MSGFMTNLIKNYLKAQKIKCVIQKMSKMYLLTCLNNNLRCMYPNLVSGVSSLSVIICHNMQPLSYMLCLWRDWLLFVWSCEGHVVLWGNCYQHWCILIVIPAWSLCLKCVFLKEMLKSSWMPCYFTTVTCYLAGYLKPLL